MTKDQKYQELRTRINKHCPYLTELRFGCEVLVEDDDVRLGPEVGKFIRVDDKDEKDIWADVAVLRQGIVEGGSRYRVLEGAYVKDILGLPPTLQDVLLAVGQYDMVLKKVSVEPADTKYLVAWGKDHLFHYDLTKSLADQSDETLGFLLSVSKEI